MHPIFRAVVHRCLGVTLVVAPALFAITGAASAAELPISAFARPRTASTVASTTECPALPADLFGDGLEAGDTCRWSTELPGAFCPAPTCGDGLQAASEACDDGNTITEDHCAAGLSACRCCSSDCHTVLDLITCSAGLSACNGTCVDFSTGVPQADGTTIDCGGCGAAFTCGAGSSCSNGTCTCPFGQTLCNGSCKTLSADALNCGACGNVCGTGTSAGKPLCVAGSCAAQCPSPLIDCGGGACIDPRDDNDNCGSCGTQCTGGQGCSAGKCAAVLGPYGTPDKCTGGGPPIVVPRTGGGTVCTGDLGATAFTFGLCSRSAVGPLSSVLATDAFDSTAGPYVASCTTAADCAGAHCRRTLAPCTGTPGSVGSCTGGTTDLCEYPVPCVAGTCVGGGVGVNGTTTPAASNTGGTVVGGDFWVYGAGGLGINSNTQVKQRLIDQGSINVTHASTIYGRAVVAGPWTSGGGASLTIDDTLFTKSTCPPLSASTLTLNGSPQCTQVANWYDPLGTTEPPPPCGRLDGTDGSLIDVRAIVDYYRDPAHNDNAAIGLPSDVLVAPAAPARLDLPCGYYYLDQMNIAQDTTIVVHGRTALFVGGALRVGQKLVVDLDPTATLDIFVGAVVATSNVMELGSPAYPRRSRLYVGSASCKATGSCTNPADCCSGVCTGGNCTTDGGGPFSQSISLSNSGVINGLLWGGQGEVSHQNSLEMAGAIYASSFSAGSDTRIHFDVGATKIADECPALPASQTCTSCRDCVNQACVDDGVGKHCGACTMDSQCCPPLRCDTGTGTCRQ